MNIWNVAVAAVTIHAVPYGTDLVRAPSLAVNCQATITESLWDCFFGVRF
jgi:hypothetical protein